MQARCSESIMFTKRKETKNEKVHLTVSRPCQHGGVCRNDELQGLADNQHDRDLHASDGYVKSHDHYQHENRGGVHGSVEMRSGSDFAPFFHTFHKFTHQCVLMTGFPPKRQKNVSSHHEMMYLTKRPTPCTHTPKARSRGRAGPRFWGPYFPKARDDYESPHVISRRYDSEGLICLCPSQPAEMRVKKLRKKRTRACVCQKKAVNLQPI